MAQKTNKKVTYIATSLPIDEEMKERIKKHQVTRPKDWGLIEGYKDFDFSSIISAETILLDCITIMVTNIIFDELKDWDNFDQLTAKNIEFAGQIEEIVLAEIRCLINKLRSRIGVCFLVTNEIGLGLVPESFSNRIFRDILGQVNKLIATEADEVHFCISGIDMKIKG